MTKSKILLVDDQATERRLLYHALKKDYDIVEAMDRNSAMQAFRHHQPELVVLDLHLPPHLDEPTEGLRLQQQLHVLSPELPIVIASGDQDRRVALELVRNGVADFLLKPVDPEVLRVVVLRAIERAALVREAHELRAEVRERYGFGALVGESTTMAAVFAKLHKLAQSNTTVLLLGETGTGKSAVARALHVASSRADNPFVVVDGASIAESLMESELFGHVRGAFTGANADKPGRIEEADGGTLFLDEIGNLTQTVQAKLLLFMDDRSVRRVGSSSEKAVDVRVIAATNADLAHLVREGGFREDLLYRIQVASVTLPPLRERVEDIVPLSHAFLVRLAREMQRPRPSLSDRACEQLQSYAWPGNVRQLKHVLETSLVLLEGDVLDVRDLVLPDPSEAPVSRAPDGAAGDFKNQVSRFERQLLVDALERASGNKAAAGRTLGLDENQIRYLCRKYGLKS